MTSTGWPTRSAKSVGLAGHTSAKHVALAEAKRNTAGELPMIDLKTALTERFIEESTEWLDTNAPLTIKHARDLSSVAISVLEERKLVNYSYKAGGKRKLVQVSDADADGHRRPDKFVGKRYFHPKTGRIYCVDAFGVDSQRDLWLLLYSCENLPLPNDFDDLEEFRIRNGSDPINRFVHTVGDFTREGRFLEVKS